MQPFVAEYWHIGAITIRFFSSSFPTLMGVKRAGIAKTASFRYSMGCAQRQISLFRLALRAVICQPADSLAPTGRDANLLHGAFVVICLLSFTADMSHEMRHISEQWRTHDLPHSLKTLSDN
jgi:hypothetical protein